MATAAVPSLAVNGVKMATFTQAYLATKPVRESNLFFTELCRQFSSLGWVSGFTGGSVAIKVHRHSVRKLQQRVVIPPSGVLKEMMEPEDMYVLSSEGTAKSSPTRKPNPRKPPKSNYGPLFMKVECYNSLFDAAVKLHQIGFSWPTPSYAPLLTIKGSSRRSKYAAAFAKGGGDMEPTRRCIVLDIEGTTTPISFVTDVLFPYARDNVGRHLNATYDTPETQDDIKLLRAQIEDDLEKGVAGAVPVPPESEGKEKVVAALVANVEAMIRADRKITALKQLQGHIWRTGFQNSELEGIVYDDVPNALERWHASGIKIYIYSSGSRLAQRLIFGNTNFGDLRKYLSGFFDTNVGNKREIHSYVEIAESVGVDSPSEILFLTDVYQEATAAKAAGLDVIVSVRQGNVPLPENHGFKTVTSFSDI